MSNPHYITFTRLTSPSAPSAVKIVTDKKTARLIKIGKKFFDSRVWYTDRELYKAFGELEQCKPAIADVIHRADSLVSFEVGQVSTQEPKLEPKLGTGF